MSQKVRPGKLAKIFCVLFFSADPLDTYTFQSCHFLLCLLFLASRIKDLTVLICIRGQFCQCPIIANVFSFSLKKSLVLFLLHLQPPQYACIELILITWGLLHHYAPLPIPRAERNIVININVFVT